VNFFILCLVAPCRLIVFLLLLVRGLFCGDGSWGMDSEIVLLWSISPSVVSCVLMILAPNGMSSIILSCSVVGVVLQIKVVCICNCTWQYILHQALGRGFCW
jgi:hypothetical protein